MERDLPHGLRTFLLSLLALVAKDIKVSCEVVESNLPTGIATYFHKTFPQIFDENGFQFDFVEGVDEYYRQWAGCSEGEESRKYSCEKEDGILLIIALALNEIY